MFEGPDVFFIKRKLRHHQYGIDKLKLEEYENDLIMLLDMIEEYENNPRDYCTCSNCEAKSCTNKD